LEFIRKWCNPYATERFTSSPPNGVVLFVQGRICGRAAEQIRPLVIDWARAVGKAETVVRAA
jgi:hypothetical protein